MSQNTILSKENNLDALQRDFMARQGQKRGLSTSAPFTPAQKLPRVKQPNHRQTGYTDQQSRAIDIRQRLLCAPSKVESTIYMPFIGHSSTDFAIEASILPTPTSAIATQKESLRRGRALAQSADLSGGYGVDELSWHGHESA